MTHEALAQGQQQQAINYAVNQVWKTYDYDLFHLFAANREVKRSHVDKLKKSFESRYLQNPILVNEHFYIVDGQHRFVAAKELGLPIFYIITNGYGLSEVHILNSNMENWGKPEWAHYYSTLGYPSYQFFLQLMEEYNFGTWSAEAIFKYVNSVTGDGNNNYVFKDGELNIADESLAFRYADMIYDFQSKYSEVYRSCFVKACLGLFNHPKYNHKRMLQKLNTNVVSLVHASNIKDYKYQLQQVYNFKTRNDNRIHLL